jgi:hypothetical protein
VRAGVTEDVTIMNATDTITLIEGYDAMQIFGNREHAVAECLQPIGF